jgi:signal transduction histidine kinase
VGTSRWLRFAATGTWAVCGLPAIAAIARTPGIGAVSVAWAAVFIAYGAGLVIALRYRTSWPRAAIALAAMQSATAVVMTDLTGRYLDGTGVGLLTGVGLMVIVASQLPHLVKPAVAWLWIAWQTCAMALLVGHSLPFADVVTFGLGSAGFQAFAWMTTALMLREASARAELAITNTELHATRARLAEHSRAGERVRIARDLHDTLGHHLTALSLQLDVASRLATGAAAGHVGQAHAVTRLLLAEVRSVVSQMRDGSQTDLAHAIRMLADPAGTPRIHIDVPERLTLDDNARAQSLLRCVQEIITNTSRHAQARNLWIRLRSKSGGLELLARDDGRGAADGVEIGNGLKGMRERFAEYAGRVEFDASDGHGFEIRGFMPAPEASS